MRSVTAKPIRKTLGRYELVRHLASGGMADVLLARATGIEGFERHVVLKRIHAEQARDARFVQMFLDEARLAASLHHHSIAAVHDIGQDDGEYFFAMEYVHGEDLRKVLMHVSDRELRVPIEHVIQIVTTTAAALHHAHEHRSPDRKLLGIVHRDVSPANILVGYDGHVKVVDFGIAKATQRTTETQSGLLKGKVAYMSPEQCVGSNVDRRSDIFCLGIVLYELATVRRLFKEGNDFLTMRAITSGVIPKPTEVCPNISPELEAIILKALAQDPADRYQTADEMRAAIERFAEAARIRSTTTALAEYMRTLFGERPLPWVADEDDPEVELTYDFDGSASGIAPAPSGFELPAAFAPHSPIARARTKAITDAPPPGVVEPVRVSRPSGSTAAVDPLLKPEQRRTRKLAAIGGGVLAVAVIAIAIFALRSPSDAGAPAPQPAAAVPAPPPPTPKTVRREPVTPPNMIKTSADAGQPVEAAPTPPAAKPKPPTAKKPPKKPPARGTWDPNALFPKQK